MTVLEKIAELTEQDYAVTFKHADSGKKVLTTLSVKNGDKSFSNGMYISSKAFLNNDNEKIVDMLERQKAKLDLVAFKKGKVDETGD